MSRREFLVAYDYGMGGLWGVVRATSASEIRRKYPELQVVTDYPAWMSEDTRRGITAPAAVMDIAEPPRGLLEAVLADRSSQRPEIGTMSEFPNLTRADLLAMIHRSDLSGREAAVEALSTLTSYTLEFSPVDRASLVEIYTRRLSRLPQSSSLAIVVGEFLDAIRSRRWETVGLIVIPAHGFVTSIWLAPDGTEVLGAWRAVDRPAL